MLTLPCKNETTYRIWLLIILQLVISITFPVSSVPHTRALYPFLSTLSCNSIAFYRIHFHFWSLFFVIVADLVADSDAVSQHFRVVHSFSWSLYLCMWNFSSHVTRTRLSNTAWFVIHISLYHYSKKNPLVFGWTNKDQRFTFVDVLFNVYFYTEHLTWSRFRFHSTISQE